MCDNCSHWWHYRCVPLSPTTIKSFETDPSTTFSCPLCAGGEAPGKRGTEPWRSVKHLGTLLDTNKDIDLRISRANAAFASLGKIWSRKHLIKERKRLMLFEAFVKPHLLYNLGTQALNKQSEERLDAVHRKMLRRALGIFFPHKISNQALYRRTGQRPISEVARLARWKLFGHLLRQDQATPANQATCAYFRAKQTFQHRAGTKRSCLMETLRQDLLRVVHVRGLLLECEEDVDILRELAADRAQWSELCRTIADRES